MRYCLDYLDENSKRLIETSGSISYKSNAKLNYQRISNGYILPGKSVDGKCLGGVLDFSGDFIMSSAWHEGEIGGKYSIDLSTSKLCRDKVIFIGYLYGLWGHMLTDCMKKLWFLFTQDGQELISDGYRIVYVSMNNKPLPEYCRELFCLAGVDSDKWERVSELSQFYEIIVPDNSFWLTENGRFFTEEYANTINRIEENVINERASNFKWYKNIYLTRTQLKNYKDFGEKAVEKIFKKEGYKIISPEKYTISEQIYFMMKCDSIATTEGSIAHNSVFCRPETNLIIIRKSNYINSYQTMINDMKNLKVTYIDANHTLQHNKPKWVGPFYLCVTPNLKKYFHKSSITLPYFFLLSYWKYIIYIVLKKMKHIMS